MAQLVGQMRGNFREKIDATGNATGNAVGSETGNATGSAIGGASRSAARNETGSDVYEFTEPSLGSKSPLRESFKNSRTEDSQEIRKSNTSQSGSNSYSSSILASKPNGLSSSAGNPHSNSLASKSQISNQPGTSKPSNLSKPSISISSTSNVPLPPSWKDEDFQKLTLMLQEHQKKKAKSLDR